MQIKKQAVSPFNAGALSGSQEEKGILSQQEDKRTDKRQLSLRLIGTVYQSSSACNGYLLLQPLEEDREERALRPPFARELPERLIESSESPSTRV